MDNGEDCFFLLLYGVLTSSQESQHNDLKKKRMSFGFMFRNSKADEICTSTDDEENDSNIVYGISTSVQGITMPNMIVNIYAMSRLFSWMNPILLLLFSLFGTIIITALLGFSKTALIAYLYSLISGCFHGTIFRGGLIILCESDFGTRAVFAMHALFAAGIFLMSLLSTFILSGAAVPYSHFSKLPDNHNVFNNHLLMKREMNLLSEQSGDDIFFKSSISNELATSKPDHVVGVELIAEPKTQENVQKRKEAIERMKSKEERQSLVTNGSLYSNEYSGVQEPTRNQNNFAHSNTSAAYVSSIFHTSSFPYLGKNDKGTARSMDQTETITVSNTAGVFYSLTKTNSVTANFIFSDVSFSFSGLNWNVGTIPLKNFWMLESLEQEASPNLFTDLKKMAISWRTYSVLFFLLAGGIERVVGESLTFYALFRPELSFSQRNGLFLTSAFWLGIVTVRVLFVLMTKFINIGRLSNFVFFSAAVAGYVAASARSLFAVLCTMFILGLSLGPLSPFLFCWLAEQELSSYLSLSLLYAIVVCVSFLFAYIALIMVIRTVRVTIRLNAIKQFSSCANSEVNRETAGQSKIRNGDYVVLVDKSDGRFDISDSDSSAEDSSLNELIDRCYK
ncbi:unnamed protein product [Onchocerca ochengi]|uniref:MFS_1_like domain-containing protein n=1 Tax=Onchocerca ochengi TaxID=42157 RepID=A0A182DZS0_ONCOC|nr:unnamed protein product [Onchocerca ochengi]